LAGHPNIAGRLHELVANSLPKSKPSILAGDDVREHFRVLREMDAINKVKGCSSHTTERFRFELLYYLLDNERRGPIIEVGTYNGGFTSLFAYVAAITGRALYGIDVDAARCETTIETCAAFDLDVSMHCGTLNTFRLEERADLVFLDSDHSYRVTYEELELLHKNPPRCLVLHDFNYRQHHQTKAPSKEMIAVDQAVADFFADKQKPVMKRIGGFAWDGTVNTPDDRGGIGPEGDYVKHCGSEGMMLIYPHGNE
jgi:predicted O-methyltransferase YrrM